MYPVNQVFLGDRNPYDVDSQLNILRQYEAQLNQLNKGTLHTVV